MSSVFFRSGNIYTARSNESVEVLETLPAGTYLIKKNEMTGELFLQSTENLDVPAKIYGSSPKERSSRIINTFLERFDSNKSTGVLLSGDKGSGKTLLTKVLSQTLRDQNIPTIVINVPWCGQAFNELIGQIKQPAMILFDEFEKVYDDDDQQSLLTLLDGTVSSSKLFVFTTNGDKLNAYLTNRPGRIYYSYSYSGVDSDFLQEYADDKLKNKDHMKSLKMIHSTFASFTFDMLSALIEEMNRYDEDATQAIKHLNMDISRESSTYEVSVILDGKPVNNKFYPQMIYKNPLYVPGGQEVSIYADDDDEKLNIKKFTQFDLSGKNLVNISDGGNMTFEHPYGKKKIYIILNKYSAFSFDYRAF
jgi:hypothetical protein